MDVKCPFLANLWRIDTLETFVFDFRKLAASSEARYCAKSVYLSLFINTLDIKYAREIILVVTFTNNLGINQRSSITNT